MSQAASSFIYVKVPVGKVVGDQDLGRVEALDQALRERGCGAVLGWGESRGSRRPDIRRPTSFLRVDVEVADLETGREALREILAALAAPPGTEIHYKLAGQPRWDLRMDAGWLLAQGA